MKIKDEDDDDRDCEGDKDEHPLSPLKIPYVNETRFSDGKAAFFFDIISPLFEKSFGTEAAKDFKAF